MPKEFKTPADIPLICMLAAGESDEAKLALARANVMSLCKYMNERGYEFGVGSNGPLRFFEEDKHAAQAGSDLMQQLLCIFFAEELLEKKQLLIRSKGQLNPNRN